MKDLLVLLGKRVHELRAAKKWSQEEFAHISGLHRTYIGQIERGEKNISFANLLKISGVLGVTMSELLSGLEDSAWPERERAGRSPNAKTSESRNPMFEVHRLIKRLKLQRAAMDRTVEFAGRTCARRARSRWTASGEANTLQIESDLRARAFSACPLGAYFIRTVETLLVRAAETPEPRPLDFLPLVQRL